MRKEIIMDVKTNIDNYDSAIYQSKIIAKKYIKDNDPTDLWYESVKNMIVSFIYENKIHRSGFTYTDNYIATISTVVDSVPKEIYHKCIQQRASSLLSFIILRKLGSIEFDSLRLLQDYIDCIVEGDF